MVGVIVFHKHIFWFSVTYQPEIRMPFSRYEITCNTVNVTALYSCLLQCLPNRAQLFKASLA